MNVSSLPHIILLILAILPSILFSAEQNVPDYPPTFFEASNSNNATAEQTAAKLGVDPTGGESTDAMTQVQEKLNKAGTQLEEVNQNLDTLKSQVSGSDPSPEQVQAMENMQAQKSALEQHIEKISPTHKSSEELASTPQAQQLAQDRLAFERTKRAVEGSSVAGGANREKLLAATAQLAKSNDAFEKYAAATNTPINNYKNAKGLIEKAVLEKLIEEVEQSESTLASTLSNQSESLSLGSNQYQPEISATVPVPTREIGSLKADGVWVGTKFVPFDKELVGNIPKEGPLPEKVESLTQSNTSPSNSTAASSASGEAQSDSKANATVKNQINFQLPSTSKVELKGVEKADKNLLSNLESLHSTLTQKEKALAAACKGNGDCKNVRKTKPNYLDSWENNRGIANSKSEENEQNRQYRQIASNSDGRHLRVPSSITPPAKGFQKIANQINNILGTNFNGNDILWMFLSVGLIGLGFVFRKRLLAASKNYFSPLFPSNGKDNINAQQQDIEHEPPRKHRDLN